MRLRYVLDASVMAAVINMDDPEHQSCYWFFQNLRCRSRYMGGAWPIFFELQAVRARRNRDKVEDRPPYGRIPLYMETRNSTKLRLLF
jgi:hypothetical protein